MAAETQEYNEVAFDALLKQFGDYERWDIPGYTAQSVDQPVSDSTKSLLMRQTGFLANFCRSGTVLRAAALSGINRETAHQWMRDDVQNFNIRMTAARSSFLDRLEDMAFERILHPNGRIGSDILMITMLNAHAPEKYRTGIVVVDETPRAVAAKLAKMAQEDKQERDQAPAASRQDNITAIEQMRAKASN